MSYLVEGRKRGATAQSDEQWRVSWWRANDQLECSVSIITNTSPVATGNRTRKSRACTGTQPQCLKASYRHALRVVGFSLVSTFTTFIDRYSSQNDNVQIYSVSWYRTHFALLFRITFTDKVSMKPKCQQLKYRDVLKKSKQNV